MSTHERTGLRPTWGRAARRGGSRPRLRRRELLDVQGIRRDLSVVIGRGTTVDPVEGARDYAKPQLGAHVARPWLRHYTMCVVAADLTAALIALIASAPMWHLSPASSSWLPAWAPHAVLAVLFPLVWVTAVAMSRTYEHRFVGNGGEEYRRLLQAGVVLLAFCATMSVAFEQATSSGTGLARSLVLMAIPVAMCLTMVVHWSARQGLYQRRRRGECAHRVVVVGRERSVAELVRLVQREPHAGLQVVAACVDHARDPSVEGVPILGNSDQILDALAQTGADTVAVTAWSDVSQTDLRRLSWDLEGTGVSVLVAPRLTDVSGPRIHIRPVAGLPLLNVEEPEFSGVRRVVKGGLDRSFALVAVVLLSPVLLTVALAIRLTSPGPVVFRQVRIGRHGEPFVIHKFRSMYVDAEQRLQALQDDNETDGVLFKMKDDPRVTRVGRFIRRYSLDELPQFFDVLNGSMSLVGPRPPLPSEVARYPLDVRRRLIVKPGITGLWQVSGRSDLSWEDSVRLDLLYVENWSLASDVTILLRTALVVLRRNGAY